MEERDIFSIEVGEEDAGKRLDKFLAEKMQNRFSRAFLQRLIRDGNVLVDGSSRKNHYTIEAGERIEVVVTSPSESDVMAENIPLDIVYEDADLLVVNKAADMVVHPAPGNYSGTLVNALLAHCRNLSGIGGVVKPGIVHRLDKGTSGLLVVAKSDMSHRNLSKQFKAKAAKRVYVALVKGVVRFDNGIIEAPLARDRRDRKKMAVDFEGEKSRRAITRYHVLERFKDSTLLEIVLGTGRTHQVRVHMAHIGYPVLGDATYGGGSDGLKRPMLHAKTLGFVHPATAKYMEFTSSLPRDMEELIEKKKRL
ncbi:MAG: RluA family pseudouridine synthase [Candidatus Omnitrophica bacterium]|nr:RluA family pseudouridine synthase [Candidatus Omnitrophota bacterium]MCM8790794.1 RluA family pseudouridine synthase [Candidatus Omnitrophota bacterium]